MKFKKKNPLWIRRAEIVAIACCEEVFFMHNSSYVIRPSCLSVNGDDGDGDKETEAEVVFRFENGIVATIFLYDLSRLAESWRDARQLWVVTRVRMKYYPSRESHYYSPNRNVEKVEEEWGPDKLRVVKKSRPWYDPHIAARNEIEGRIGIFWNNSSKDGTVQVDPDYNQDGFYTLTAEIPYCPLVSGDKERVVSAAQIHLKKGNL